MSTSQISPSRITPGRIDTKQARRPAGRHVDTATGPTTITERVGALLVAIATLIAGADGRHVR